MDIDQSRIDSLIAAPSEGLNIEVKRWINPDEPEGISKIVKGVFAIRNRNGGFFIVGFDDKTLLPDTQKPLQNPRTLFHLDKIQGIISDFAADGFEISVGFSNRDGQEYPVIVVPEGIRTTLAARRDLKDKNGKYLVREGDVYFRTLKSNGTPSTARARPTDWPDILEICFENREADIGRFLRRHLTGQGIERFMEMLGGLRVPTETASAPPGLRDRALSLLDSAMGRFYASMEARAPDQQAFLTGRGTWSVSLVIDPPRDNARPDRDFLGTVLAANPSYTGWPVWLDSRTFTDDASHPEVIDRAWQTLIISIARGWSSHVDFMRFDPKGEFYLLRLLPDDLQEKIDPGTVLDVILVVIRVAEAIAVGLSIGKVLELPADARLGFGFRWTGLGGRKLSSWANPLAGITPGYRAHDNAVDTFVEIPLETAISAIAPYVQEATRDLFVLFNGYTFPDSSTEHWVQRLVERRLSGH
jgi:hypothetical protein